MRVTVIGAAGSIGRVLVAGLAESGHEVTGLDRRRQADLLPGRFIEGDLTDGPTLERAFDGADAVVHLAAVPHESDFDTAVQTHVYGTRVVLEACRRLGIQRLVYASSNHAIGFSTREDGVDASTLPRPDTFYGWGKAASEALCRLYHDRFGIAVACLRIGSFESEPRSRRHLSTWLSPGDAVRLVDACLTAPKLGFTVAYGISANTRGWWDLSSAYALGYRPENDAEWYAEVLEQTPETDEDRLDAVHAGGPFARIPLGEEMST